MSSNSERVLAERDKAVLARIAAHGAFICSGGCEQRQSGQLHCVNLSRQLGTTNRRVWQTVIRLVDAGLLERQRDEVAHCWRFVLTESGRQLATPEGSIEAEHGGREWPSLD